MMRFLERIVNRRFVIKTGASAALGLAGMKLGAREQRSRIKLPITVQITASRGLPEDIVPPVFQLASKPPNTFSSKLQWTPLENGGFEQKNKYGQRMVIEKDGLASIYDPNGKQVYSAIFPQAADLYRALVKSQEMLQKVR